MSTVFAGRSLALLALANISMQNDTNSATLALSDISQSPVDGDIIPFPMPEFSTIVQIFIFPASPHAGRRRSN